VGMKLDEGLLQLFGMGRVFKVRPDTLLAPALQALDWLPAHAMVSMQIRIRMSIHNNSRETVWRGSSSPQQDNAGRINSLDFHRREDLLVTAGDDDSVHLYNIQSGTMDKTVFSRKYGVSHIRFTHHPQSVVYASNKVQCVGLHAPVPGVQLCALR